VSVPVNRDCRENLFRDFCANQRNLREKRVFQRKSPCRSAEEDFFNPADIADHRGENLFRDFCANQRRSAGEKSFSAQIRADLPESFYYLE